jgi:hypothetical protein
MSAPTEHCISTSRNKRTTCQVKSTRYSDAGYTASMSGLKTVKNKNLKTKLIKCHTKIQRVPVPARSDFQLNITSWFFQNLSRQGNTTRLIHSFTLWNSKYVFSICCLIGAISKHTPTCHSGNPRD